MVLFTWVMLCLNPVLGSMFVLCGIYSDRKHVKQYSIMLGLIFAVFAYQFTPNHEMDLTRYFDMLHSYNGLSWNIFADHVLNGKLLVLQELLFYAIAQTGNYHLLPAFTIFVTYSIMFYMISDYANRTKINSTKLIFIILFVICVLPFSSLVSNVRNILSFSLFVFAVYRDFEQKKRNILTYILYIVPIFIHISAIALIILRMIVPLYGTFKKWNLIIAAVVVSSTVFIDKLQYIVNFIPFGSSYANAFVNKSNSYVNTTNSDYALYLQNNLFMNLQKGYFILSTIFFLIILYFIVKRNRKEESNQLEIENPSTKLESFFKLLCLTVVGCAPIVLTVYARFAFPVIMLSFIFIGRINLIIPKVFRQLIFLGIIIVMIGGLTQQLLFMSKMTNIPHLFISSMSKNIFNSFIP